MVEFKRILVPLDGSPLAERAIPVATALAAKFSSEIILLHVVDIPEPTAPISHPEVTIGWVREARAQALQEAQTYLDACQQKIHRQGIAVCAVVCDRSPAEDVLKVVNSEKVDLIVMSSHGHGGQAHWTFGGVADKVVRHSPCPLLIVRYVSSGTASAL